MPLILSNDDIRASLDVDQCLRVMEDSYRELAASRAVNRPTCHAYLPHPLPHATYSFKSVDGGVAKFGVHALRVTSDIVREEHRDGAVRLEKLPLAGTGQFVGLIQLFSAETGELLAIMPDGVIQQTRVAVTSALAARIMARPDATSLAIIGSGGQARAHSRFLTAVLPLTRVRVYSPSPERRLAFARDLEQETGVPAEATGSAEAAVSGCDVLCTATNSSRPVISAAWLRPGMHYNAIREFEMDDDAFDRCDVVAIHTRFGGIHHYLPPGATADLPGIRREKPRDWTRYPELADLIAGSAPGRLTPGQTSLFLNNVGTGVQFAGLGYCAFQVARARGLGHEIPGDWFMQDIKP